MSLDSPPEQRAGIAHVHADEKPGVRDVLSRLRIAGDRRLGVLVGPVYRTERLDVAEELFPGRIELIEAESWLPHAGMAATRSALARHRDLGAFFCADDLLAIGALQACAEKGLAVPDDISVIGFGGYQLGEYGIGELTTVHWPLRRSTRWSTISRQVTGVHGFRPPQRRSPGCCRRKPWCAARHCWHRTRSARRPAR
ncbi:substrate-binding domain-containing protein [Micromonospora zamorensis]|uniref:substrate-binding domain-containing protein n=1 Tax=Micromonospora zamorensis TaxID=709883 RepID=UPI0033ADB9BB